MDKDGVTGSEREARIYRYTLKGWMEVVPGSMRWREMLERERERKRANGTWAKRKQSRGRAEGLNQ